MKISELKKKYNLKNGDHLTYKGKVWTIKGNKLVNPLPVEFIQSVSKYSTHWQQAIKNYLSK